MRLSALRLAAVCRGGMKSGGDKTTGGGVSLQLHCLIHDAGRSGKATSEA